MKKYGLIFSALCLVLICLSVVSCSDPATYEEIDWSPEVPVYLEFDLYIISDAIPSTDSAKAQKTVNSKINQIINEKYLSTVNIHYCSADEYSDVVDEIIENNSYNKNVSANRYFGGTIILINSEEVYEKLRDANKLVDLYHLLQTKDFGTLNISITGALLEAAKEYDGDNAHLYCIPNDHIIGEYEFTIINRSIAEGKLNFSAQSELLDMIVVDGVPSESADLLIESVEKNLDLLGINSVSEVIRNEKGSYADKSYWESLGYICNIASYPKASSSEAYSSAFGVLKAFDIKNSDETVMTASECEKRAMQIIYAINTDSNVRNLLQYGVENTHYTLSDNVVTSIDGSCYKMNLLYTGNAFLAYFDENWTAKNAQDGKIQNSEAVVEK